MGDFISLSAKSYLWVNETLAASASFVLTKKHNNMKKLTTLAICLMIFQAIIAQAPGTVTTVEGVYGGRINAIVGGATGTTVLSDTFQIFVATESANSIFYALGHFGPFGSASVESFTSLPSANAAAGFGSSISKMAFHKNSGTLYFIASGNIYSTTATATAATKLTTTNDYIDIKLSGNHFFALTASGTNNTLYYSTISSTGALTASSNMSSAGVGYTNIVIGQDDYLYIYKSGTDPMVTKFANTITSGVNLASTTGDFMGSLSPSYSWDAMGVYSDGTIFVGGTNGGTNPYKYIGTASTFGGAYTTIATGISGTSGTNIEFKDGIGTNYLVYFGTAYSTAKGAAATWTTFGNSGLDTHPNDGTVTFFTEKTLGKGILMLTTDAGLGITKNGGSVISDINDGILATQVEDFDMNSSKTFGWLAAKDGIRYVNNYNTSAKAWTTGMWPNGDGSPYYSAEMVGNDTNKAYVGNVRIYKTTNKGTSWSQVFTPENAPYSFPSVGVRAEAISVSDSDNNVVMAGYYNQNSGQYGGVFYSVNGGTSWSQLLINATTSGQDVNVYDIEMTTDSGKIVAYIGVEYINSTVRGMYKAQYNGATWTVRREEIYGASTSKFTVNDIVIVSKDTIAAVGSFYNPVQGRAYPIYFNISRNIMNDWRSTVNDTTRQNAYTACAWNRDTMFYAYSNNIYYDIISFNATSTSRVGEALYASVDNGTEINILYYDELLCGSTTGFRSLKGATKVYEEPVIPTVSITASKTSICVNQNVTFTATVTNATHPTYTWKVNNNTMGGNSSSFTTNALPNNAQVTCTISNDGQTATSNTITILVYGNPFVSNITGVLSVCAAGTTAQVSDATPNGVWSSSNTSIATISSTGLITAKANGSTNIIYTVTNAGGCSNSMNAVFNVAPQAVPIIGGGNVVCVGSTVSLSNNTPNTTSAWSSTAGRATISNTGIVTGTSAGTATIKLIATNTFGCSNSNTYNITVNAQGVTPTISYAPGTASPQGNGGLCTNKTFTVVGKPAGGTWSKTGVISITNAGVITTGNTPGAMSVTYTINGGCSSSRTVTMNVVSCASKGISSQQSSVEINQLIVYPNPARSVFSVNIKTLTGAGSIVVTDLLGKQVKQQALSIGTNTIDVNSISKGMYLVAIELNGERKVQKLVIE